jgi:hypothetical protein
MAIAVNVSSKKVSARDSELVEQRLPVHIQWALSTFFF